MKSQQAVNGRDLVEEMQAPSGLADDLQRCVSLIAPLTGYAHGLMNHSLADFSPSSSKLHSRCVQ